MSSRPLFAPASVITNGDMSSDIISAVTIATNMTMISYGVTWTGSTPVGTAQVEISNDYSVNPDGSVRSAGNWSIYPGATAAVSGNSGTGFFNVSQISAYAIRLRYIHTSGTGTMNATVMGKVE